MVVVLGTQNSSIIHQKFVECGNFQSRDEMTKKRGEWGGKFTANRAAIFSHSHGGYAAVHSGSVELAESSMIYLFAFARSNDVDDLELGVDEENVFWLEVGVWQLVGV